MERNQLNDVMQRVDVTIVPLGYECIEAEWLQADRALVVYIDKTEGKVDLNDCVAVTRILNEEEILDAEMPENSRLEVSTPGVDRPLRRVGDFPKFLGEEVHVTLTEKVGERKKSRGRLVSITNDGIITIELNSGDEWIFPVENLRKAYLIGAI